VSSNDGGGINITRRDAIRYTRKLAAEAKRHGMSMGLKNAAELLRYVIRDMAFFINESCSARRECGIYNRVLRANKPVFHIEYVSHSKGASGQLQLKSKLPGLYQANTETIREVLCLEKRMPRPRRGKGMPKELGDDEGFAWWVPRVREPKKFSTVIKGDLLDEWVYFCDGTTSITPVMNVGTGGPTDGYC